MRPDGGGITLQCNLYIYNHNGLFLLLCVKKKKKNQDNLSQVWNLQVSGNPITIQNFSPTWSLPNPTTYFIIHLLRPASKPPYSLLHTGSGGNNSPIKPFPRHTPPTFLLQPKNQIRYRANLQTPPSRKRHTPLTPEHSRVLMLSPGGVGYPIVDKLANDCGFRLPRKPTKLHRRLCVAAALVHSPRSGAQGEDMTRAAEVLGTRVCVRKGAACEGAVVGRDARGDGRVAGVHRESVRRSQRILGACDHGRKGELVA